VITHAPSAVVVVKTKYDLDPSLQVLKLIEGKWSLRESQEWGENRIKQVVDLLRQESYTSPLIIRAGLVIGDYTWAIGSLVTRPEVLEKLYPYEGDLSFDVPHHWMKYNTTPCESYVFEHINKPSTVGEYCSQIVFKSSGHIQEFISINPTCTARPFRFQLKGSYLLADGGDRIALYDSRTAKEVFRRSGPLDTALISIWPAKDEPFQRVCELRRNRAR
jgi:hypothetical protein